MNAAAVCRKFETSRRREVLGFKHRAEVAALPAADADANGRYYLGAEALSV